MDRRTGTDRDPEGYSVSEPRYHEEAQCYVQRVTYDFKERRGVLLMGDGSCTDMSGCIRVFERIDPDVQRIDTYAGPVPDTVYRRHSERFGGWRAYPPAHTPNMEH